MGQINAFKETVFSWCKMHGIENKKEFQQSLSFLREWLTEQSQNEDGDVDYDVSHNAQVLHDFLMRNLLPHKSRFLVYLRNDRLYLDYRSTSALESQFQKMKKKCSPCLSPNMTLLTSIKVQDSQRQAKMDLRKKVAFKQYNSSPNHSHGSETKDQASPCISLFISVVVPHLPCV